MYTPRYSVCVLDGEKWEVVSDHLIDVTALEVAAELRAEGKHTRAFDWVTGGDRGTILDSQTEGEA